MSNRPDASAGQGLRLLCLDGGGVRGLVSLLILQRLMYRVNPINPPKPCDVFDMIVGTSTGGLIAIMLGRLKMDVSSCIKAYIDMSKDVFKPRWRAKLSGNFIPKITGTAVFNHEVLENKVRDVVELYLGDADAALLEEDPRCKVFVCATTSNTKIQRLRSYHSIVQEDRDCRIWEAARATSAAPTFFDPITFGGQEFRDGAFRSNNPIFELIEEIDVEFPRREISCIVSIGTGVPATTAMSSSLLLIAKACVSIATDTEMTASRFTKTYCSSGSQHQDRNFRHKYFRYNVTKGMEGVGLGDWKKLDTMKTNTESYLDEIESLEVCARRLSGDQSETGEAPAKHEELNLSLTVNRNPCRGINFDDFYELDRIDKQPVLHFSTRPELDQIKSAFSNYGQNDQPRILSLVGLGGSGKTQLMLKYASSERSQYGVVLWIDATSKDAITSTYQIVTSLLGLIAPPFEQAVSTSSALVKHIPELEANVNLVMRELRRRGQPWLMLFDGANDAATIKRLRKYIPSAPNGHVLISSRRKQARLSGHQTIKIEGLPVHSARSLLLYHADIEYPTESELRYTEKIVRNLGCIALAVELAGSYIENLGSPKSYLDLYESQFKEDLLAKSLGDISRVSDYDISVLKAWQMSISVIPKNVASLLHLLCFLDRTNISKSMLMRACREKFYWNDAGKLEELYPTSNGVPQWFLDLFCEDGQWSEMKYNEAVADLSSFFFVEKEVLAGQWRHHTGTIETESLMGGEDPELLKIPQPVHDVGKLFRVGAERQELCHDAFSVIVHSFWNDVPTKTLPGLSSLVMYVGQGGMIGTASVLIRRLEEVYGHIRSFQHLDRDIKIQPRCFNPQIPLWKRAETVMFATTFWTGLLKTQKKDQERKARTENSTAKLYRKESDTPWETILFITDILLKRKLRPQRERQDQDPRFAGIWTSPDRSDFRRQGEWEPQSSWERFGDEFDLNYPEALHYPSDAFLNIYHNFERKWVQRQTYYWERICYEYILIRGCLKEFRVSIYRVMALAEAELACGFQSSYNEILEEMKRGCRSELGLVGVLDCWKWCQAGQYFRRRVP